MSKPEVLLWQRLRGSPGGVKFRRQHPIGAYVADFYSAALKIVLEVDGLAHDLGERPQRDALRDDWLRRNGFQVVRIAAVEVLRDATSVADALVRLCSPHGPSTP